MREMERLNNPQFGVEQVRVCQGGNVKKYVTDTEQKQMLESGRVLSYRASTHSRPEDIPCLTIH
jgi:hypothetical protein